MWGGTYSDVLVQRAETGLTLTQALAGTGEPENEEELDLEPRD